MRHLYLHIPFCERRCAYCDFNTYANMEERIAAYVAALCGELRMRAANLPSLRPETPEAARLRPTIFFGGGTPTMLSPGQIAAILEAASALVPLEGAEISSEANPGTLLDANYLRELRAAGVNRLSLGVQTLHDPTLRVLGRSHDAAEARSAYEAARAAGFENINLDFIFGLPGQSQAQWEANLAAMIDWQPEHIALYSLILEERTPLYAQVTAGRVTVPDDDATAAMYEAAIAHLGAAGYAHYEISNWAKPGAGGPLPGLPAFACHHNLAYWLNSDYAAAGAGAHGHFFPQRYYDRLAIDDYIAAVGRGELPEAEVLALDPSDLAAETMFMGLRLTPGVSRSHFVARCGVELEAAYGEQLARLSAQGLIVVDQVGVRLTPQGQMLGNRVFAEFVG